MYIRLDLVSSTVVLIPSSSGSVVHDQRLFSNGMEKQHAVHKTCAVRWSFFTLHSPAAVLGPSWIQDEIDCEIVNVLCSTVPQTFASRLKFFHAGTTVPHAELGHSWIQLNRLQHHQCSVLSTLCHRSQWAVTFFLYPAFLQSLPGNPVFMHDLGPNAGWLAPPKTSIFECSANLEKYTFRDLAR